MWVKEAVAGLLPDISAMTRTYGAGPLGHLEGPHGPGGVLCRMELLARSGCHRTNADGLGGNSRPVSISCPSWTQAAFGPCSCLCRTFSACLCHEPEDLQGLF